MRKLQIIPGIILLLCFATLKHAQGQSNSTQKSELSETEFDQIVNRQFRELISGNSYTSVGSYASVDIKEPTATFSPNFILKNGNIIGGKLSGGVNDGLFELFSNSQLNPSVSFDFRYHFLWRDNEKKLRNGYIEYSDLELQALIDKEAELTDKHRLDTLAISQNVDIHKLTIEEASLFKQKRKQVALRDSVAKLIANKLALGLRLEAEQNIWTTTKNTFDPRGKSQEYIDSVLIVINNNLSRLAKDTTKNNFDLNLLQAQLDLAKYEIKAAQTRLSAITDKKNRINAQPIGKRMTAVNNKFYENLDLVTRDKNLKLKGFQFGWFSLGGQYRYDEFKIFNPTLPIDSQVSKKNFSSYQFRFQYSFYKWSNQHFQTVFFTVSASYNYKSNFQELKKTEITETTDHGSNSGNDRTTTKKYNVYQGSYEDSLHGFELSADLYYFMFKNNTVALHIYPSAQFASGQFPIYAVGCGLLFPFKSKEKDKPIVNVELYYTITDLFNSGNKNEDLLNRNSLGLRFAFPINFNPK